MKKIKLFFKRLLCKHKNKKEIFICYQERYIETMCKDCGKLFYDDL